MNHIYFTFYFIFSAFLKRNVWIKEIWNFNYFSVNCQIIFQKVYNPTISELK